MFAGVVRPRPVEKGERGISSSSSAARAPCGLSLYADTPDEEVTLEDFEVFAFQRLKCAWTYLTPAETPPYDTHPPYASLLTHSLPSNPSPSPFFD